MPTKPGRKDPDIRTIVVAGDVTVDWNIARARAHLGKLTTYQYIWGSDVATRACSQPGGAALLAALIEALCESHAGSSKYSFKAMGPSISEDALNNPSCDQYTRSYSIWSAFPKHLGDKRMVWRAAEFWGTDHAIATGAPAKTDEFPEDPWGLVLDDANLGFRDHQESWPECLKRPSSKTSWILAKIAHPVAQSPLWEHLLNNCADKLTVVVSVSDLRKSNMQIGYELSWEQISSEVVQAVEDDENLSKPLAVVVVLGTTGSVVLDRKSGNHLVFDPYAQEENWRRNHPGTCIGYASCYMASLVRQFMMDSQKPQLLDAAKLGVHAARTLHLMGYGEGDGSAIPDLQFPIKGVTEAFGAEEIPLASVETSSQREGWTILSCRQPLDIKRVAFDMVRHGPETSLRDIPIERVGKWSSIDRIEIENIRSLRNIMTEYAAQPHPVRPLSLAVFGPPGSGKSFAIKQVAQALMPGRLSQLEFNLSQFESNEELPAAFHRVRDCALKHALPLVFWDEFDTPLLGRELGWLRYFLVPMQDGEFHEGGIPHPLGPAIFVFAGGTHSSMASFRDTAESNPTAKGRDFMSRLRGYLDILGPNPQGEHDKAFVLRRALLLRALLLMKAKQLFDMKKVLHIDEGVLRALLLIDQYRHGARSMECIIDMSTLSDKLMFERSCLPASHQLDLHVDAEKFLNWISGMGDDTKK